MTKYLPTGGEIFAGRVARLFVLNQSQENWVEDVLRGMLEEAQNVDNWDEFGETTREEAAAYFKQLIDRIQAVPFYIGMIIDYPVALDADTGWLPCDGALYYVADYPDLYAVIGHHYSDPFDPDDQFRVPDLRGRVRAGMDDGSGRLTPLWASDIGGAGGEEAHTLTTGEIPSHAHSLDGYIPGLAVAPGELPVLTDVAVPSGTGNTGGGNPHNNTQPTMVFQPYIWATF